MKKLFLFLSVFSLISDPTKSQTPGIVSLLPKITNDKNDSSRFYLVFSGLTISETNPVEDMANAEIILLHGQKINDPTCKVLGLGCLGYDYRAFGNTAKSLEYNLKANVIAETTNDVRLKAALRAGLATNYLDLEDYPKAIAYSKSGIELASGIEPNYFTIILNLTLGEIYLKKNKIDSALYYTEAASRISKSTGMSDYFGGIYSQLGTIQTKLNKPELALNYMHLALESAIKIKSPKYTNIAYTAIAEYYQNQQQEDSAIVYAKKAIAATDNTAFATMLMKPAKLLVDIYRTNNVDSAFRYSELHKIASDSLFNIRTLQQAQLMTFEEDARQKELVLAKEMEEQQRQQYIQYALIGLGIITFIILFLLMSRSFVVNSKIISFFSAIALLIVFEFFNLLLHPLIEKITHHSPVLMLLCLVIIAALLIPLHHKLEKWTTKKLLEKNNAVRQAHAQKSMATIKKNQLN